MLESSLYDVINYLGIFERFFAVHESSSSGEMRETLIEGNMHDLQSIWKHITLGLTTCKRLHHYLETIDALQKTGILELLKVLNAHCFSLLHLIHVFI